MVEATPTIRAVRKKRLSRGWKVAIVVAGVLLVVWIASELIVPAFAASYVRNEVKKRYPQAGEVSVSVRAFPAIRLAFKDYSSLKVEVKGVTLEGINFDSIVLESRKWPQGTFEATVLPGEIMRFFSDTHSYVSQPELNLENGRIQISGKMNIGYATVTIQATGNLEARNGKQVFFDPDNVTVTGVRDPTKASTVVRDTMASNPVFVIREDLPFTVTSIEPASDKLDVKGDVDLSQALDMNL